MAKTETLVMRISHELKEDLRMAAEEEGRSISNLIERVMTVWLREREATKN